MPELIGENRGGAGLIIKEEAQNLRAGGWDGAKFRRRDLLGRTSPVGRSRRQG